MKKILLNLPSGLALYPSKLTDPGLVSQFITQLHPILPDQPFIRLGSHGDGGYLVPDDLAGITACFSPGVDFNSTFELHCAQHGMQVFMADASVEQPAAMDPSFHFIQKFIGAFPSEIHVTLEDWVNQNVPDTSADLLLQMDIEGWEYETLLATPTSILGRFRIIIMEVHRLDGLFSETLFPFLSRSLQKLLLTHTCVHIHPNNTGQLTHSGDIQIPQTMEFTFLRNDRLANRHPATTFPHPLDVDCTNQQPPITLPANWYHSAT